MLIKQYFRKYYHHQLMFLYTWGILSIFREFTPETKSWICWLTMLALAKISTKSLQSHCKKIKGAQSQFVSIKYSDRLEDRRIDTVNINNFLPLIIRKKRVGSMSPQVYTVLDHRRRRNVVRASVTHSAEPRMPLVLTTREWLNTGKWWQMVTSTFALLNIVDLRTTRNA